MKRAGLSVVSFCIVLIFALISLALLAAPPMTILAQIDPTSEQETLDASVQQLFDQTGTAVATITAQAIFNQTATANALATQTVETQFSRAQTATAVAQNAPTQTVQAMFNQAMTATAIGDVPDYGDYEVIDVQEFELMAGPLRSAAHLAPDGTKFAHFQSGDFCLYTLTAEMWAQDRCITLDEEARLRDFEDMFWSPDGRWLTVGTYAEGLMYLRDTDIRVIDMETGEIINLTDDGTVADFFDDYTGTFDLAPRWLDADTLVFIRYNSTGGSMSDSLLPPTLYSVDVPTDGALNEPELLVAIPSPFRLSTYLLAVDPRSGQAAFNFDTRGTTASQGIWQVGLDSEDLHPLAALPEPRELPSQLDYSADGRYLLTNQYTQEPDDIGVRVVSTETGEIIDIDPRYTVAAAGWSPRGLALVYAVRNLLTPENDGLYITTTPGEPGTRVLEGTYFATTSNQRMPIGWGENDVILVGRGGRPGVLLVQLGT